METHYVNTRLVNALTNLQTQLNTWWDSHRSSPDHNIEDSDNCIGCIRHSTVEEMINDVDTALSRLFKVYKV